MAGFLEGLGKVATDAAPEAIKSVIPQGDLQQTDTAQTMGTTSQAAPAGEEAALGLAGPSSQTGSAAAAQKGTTEAAKITAEAAPVAAQGVQGAQGAVKSARELAQESQDQYTNAQQAANVATLAAGEAIQKAGEMSKIDPQRYWNSLGVGNRTIASLGMVLSGIGAGLTGQPNMAMELLQRNIQRDIDAQQQRYQNGISQVAQNMQLVKNAQAQQDISAHAFFGAQQSVLTGVQSALEQAMAQKKLQSAVPAAQVTNYVLQQQKSQGIDAHTKYYQSIYNSGDVNRLNLSGAAAARVGHNVLGTPEVLSQVRPQGRVTGNVPTPVQNVAPTVPQQPAGDNIREFYNKLSEARNKEANKK